MTVDYLTRRAQEQTGGNVSAFVDVLVRDRLIDEECAALAEWEQDHRDESWDAERWAA